MVGLSGSIWADPNFKQDKIPKRDPFNYGLALNTEPPKNTAAKEDTSVLMPPKAAAGKEDVLDVVPPKLATSKEYTTAIMPPRQVTAKESAPVVMPATEKHSAPATETPKPLPPHLRKTCNVSDNVAMAALSRVIQENQAPVPVSPPTQATPVARTRVFEKPFQATEPTSATLTARTSAFEKQPAPMEKVTTVPATRVARTRIFEKTVQDSEPIKATLTARTSAFQKQPAPVEKTTTVPAAPVARTRIFEKSGAPDQDAGPAQYAMTARNSAFNEQPTAIEKANMVSVAPITRTSAFEKQPASPKEAIPAPDASLARAAITTEDALPIVGNIAPRAIPKPGFNEDGLPILFRPDATAETRAMANEMTKGGFKSRPGVVSSRAPAARFPGFTFKAEPTMPAKAAVKPVPSTGMKAPTAPSSHLRAAAQLPKSARKPAAPTGGAASQKSSASTTSPKHLRAPERAVPRLNSLHQREKNLQKELSNMANMQSELDKIRKEKAVLLREMSDEAAKRNAR